MPRVIKKSGDIEWRWYNNTPPHTRPPGLTFRREELSYDMIVAPPTTDYRPVIKMMEPVWEPQGCRDHQFINVELYIQYVALRSPDNRVGAAMLKLKRADLTPVHTCHGDLTLQNVVGNYIIDPGDPRGLPCREIDEAKIMQSLDGYDVIKYGYPPPFPCVFEGARKVHYVLLLSHYVRMLRHQKGHVLAFAQRRITELCDLLL